MKQTNRKKLRSALSLLCALTMGTSVGMFAACGGNENTGNGAKAIASYVSLDINPSIELTVDSENKVISVYGANEDGQVLLYEETGIVGADVEAAIEKITDLAVELGYLDAENKVVGVNVSSIGEEIQSDLQSKISTKITATAQELGLSVTTDVEGAYSLLRELEALKAEYPNNTAIQSVSVAKFKLAASAAQTGEVTLEAAVEMNTSELISFVSAAHTQAEAFATEAYNQAKRLANAAYEKALGMEKGKAYMEYAVSKNKTSALMYGAPYFMYQASACGFEAIADSLMYAEMIKNYELSETQVVAILQAFGLEDNAENRAKLQNSEGKITVKSVEAYADKTFKNTPAGQELENAKAALNQALTTAETTLQAEVKKVKEAYKPQIEAIITSAEAGINSLKLFQAMLPQDVQQAIADFEDVSGKVLTAIGEGTLTEETLRGYAKDMNAKAEAMLTKIKGELTEEELAEVDAEIAKIVADFEDEKAEMESKIAQAAEEAKAKLAELKAKRKTAE